MPETQIRHPKDDTNPPTFESVWAALQETDRIVKENAREMEKFKESQKETERILKEDSRRLKEELNIKIGSLTNLFGDMTEAMVAPKICEKFYEYGLIFPRANTNNKYNDQVNKISFEVDIMLENGEKAMLIEVKTKLTRDRVDKNLQRLEKMRLYADLHGDKRTFLGAVAGIVVTDEVREYALSQGFYFIEYSGENFYITPPAGKPREW